MNQEERSKTYPGINFEDDPDIEVTYHEEPPPSSGLWFEVKSISRDLIFAALVALLIVVFIIQPVKVEGTSMLPRLENEERIFVNKFVYSLNLGSIEHGDIVVFWYPEDPSKSFIKRVIGLPGDRIRMDELGQLYINGRLVDEPYLAAERNQHPRPIPEQTIKPHYYFVMGDNRDASNDSRSWGLVPEKYIYGKAMFRYWPLPRMGVID